MFAGVGCCGCAAGLAVAQRLLEGAPDPGDDAERPTVVSPATELPYEGFFHLVEALRLDPAISAPKALREVFDAVADDEERVWKNTTVYLLQHKPVFSGADQKSVIDISLPKNIDVAAHTARSKVLGNLRDHLFVVRIQWYFFVRHSQ